MRSVVLVLMAFPGLLTSVILADDKADKPKADKPAAAAQAVVEAVQEAANAKVAEQQVANEVIGGLIDGVLNLFGGGDAAPAQVFVDFGGDVAAGGDQIEQQFAPQMKPLVKAELSFIVRVLEPTKEQRKELTKVGDVALKKAVKQLADVQRKMQQGGWQMPQDGSSVYPDPRKPIQEGFEATLKTMFPAEKVEIYRIEMTQRAEARKRVALLNLVAKIDKDLVLSKDQRTKLLESLNKNWKPAWDQSLEMFMQNEEYTPRPPDDAVVPFLNETQKQVWRDSNNGQQAFWGGWGFGGGFGGVMIEDEALGN